jgi:hypothetical protein
MAEFTRHILIIILPLTLSNIIHMVVVKYHMLPWLSRPVWEKGFGRNKTYRGFVLLPLLNAGALWLCQWLLPQPVHHALLLGGVLGLAYMVFELPNSYIKRRMQIAPGERHEVHSYWGLLLDKSDSAFGVCLCYLLMTDIAIAHILALFAMSVITHLSMSIILFKIRLKAAI